MIDPNDVGLIIFDMDGTLVPSQADITISRFDELLDIFDRRLPRIVRSR